MKEEAKMVYLLECLQKTPPPVSTAGPGWAQSSHDEMGGRDGCSAGVGVMPSNWSGLFGAGAHLCREESRRGCHSRIPPAQGSGGCGHSWGQRSGWSTHWHSPAAMIASCLPLYPLPSPLPRLVSLHYFQHSYYSFDPPQTRKSGPRPSRHSGKAKRTS